MRPAKLRGYDFWMEQFCRHRKHSARRAKRYEEMMVLTSELKEKMDTQAADCLDDLDVACVIDTLDEVLENAYMYFQKLRCAEERKINPSNQGPPKPIVVSDDEDKDGEYKPDDEE